MTSTAFDLDSPLPLHPLTFHAEDGADDEVTIGRADTGEFGVFPADGAALLARLAGGAPLGEAVAWYEREYGESVDLAEFLEVLDEFGMIVRDGETAAEVAPVRWRRLGVALFSPVAWLLYSAVVIAGIVVMVAVPEVAPSYSHVFFTPSLVAVLLLALLGQIPLILVHESFHALAGRRLGIPSSLRVGRRLIFVVFETSLDGLVAVPRRQRYLPILAGLVADAVCVAGLTLVAAALRDPIGGDAGFAGRVCLSLAFFTLMRLVWQFYFFLRTDLYYLVCTALGCLDLQTVAFAMLRARFARLLRGPARPVDESDWHPRDREVARWYMWFLLAGYAFVLASVAFAIVPAVLLTVDIVVDRVAHEPSALGLADAVAFLVLTFGQFVLAGVLARRERSA
ncbi:hypothetical protein UO65_1493 [Actinokineospora spheciospongiae]|uniref:PqqD family protein n=1 Tax=Actinokineospora spheciospongiae TaxID=909613 RepID=W7JB38_9PSEU|nr:hypothetical protein [Actinokineospora spheciospongiae]EWC63279.1 hypothetical protein UO65_1493 [Actinokineospora spheciospongiae]